MDKLLPANEIKANYDSRLLIPIGLVKHPKIHPYNYLNIFKDKKLGEYRFWYGGSASSVVDIGWGIGFNGDGFREYFISTVLPQLNNPHYEYEENMKLEVD